MITKVPASIIFSIIFGAVFILSVAGGTAFYYGAHSVPRTIVPSPVPTPMPAPGSAACTQEAKLCPDGSYVGRTGPDCEFTECPSVPPSVTELSCASDADCPSTNYTCEASEGYGTVYPNNSQPPTTIITKGECKLKKGSACTSNTQCAAGLLCHSNTCTSPIGNECAGPNDTSCPAGYTCIQSCGPPVSRQDDPSPPYFCELNEYAAKPRICPICLASNSKIATPTGEVSVRDMKVGMRVWSVNSRGEKIAATVLAVSRSPAPETHKVIHIIFADGREVWVSESHPLTNGMRVADLEIGNIYDGSAVVNIESISYWDSKTYDILPSSDTGYYWANGILFASTLSDSRTALDAL